MEKMEIVKTICDNVTALLSIRLPVGGLPTAMEINQCAKSLNDLAKAIIDEEKENAMFDETIEKTTE